MPPRADPTCLLFLCGDVMLGRGVDQILAHPSEPRLQEELVHDARDYVRLAEEVNGPIPRQVGAGYVWGDALDVLPQLSKEGPFDMVFIDADKLNYLRYLDWAEENVRKGGLIVGDNTFLFDAVWRDDPVDRVRQTARDAMRDFNRRLADPQKYCGILLPTQEGMTVALKLF